MINWQAFSFNGNKLMKTFLRFCFFVLCIAFLFSACSHKMAFVKSVVVPGASGKATVSKDDNNNYKISVSVKDLTDPKNLVPSKQTYVVWNESSEGVKNIGQLDPERSFLHRGYKASLNALSPYKPKRIFISAEDDGKTQSPGTQIVLTTE